jgi:hypothetical protein
MSTNTPNWAEKANLALNVIQIAQLGQLNSAFEALRCLEAARASLELDARQSQECEDRIRDFIWQAERAFLDYSQKAAATPAGNYALAKQIQGGFQQSGVMSASLRQFADKDRLDGLQRRLQETIENEGGKLSPDQRAEAETYLQYSSDLEELDYLGQGQSLLFYEAEEACQRGEDAKLELAQVIQSLVDPDTAGLIKRLGTEERAARQERETSWTQWKTAKANGDSEGEQQFWSKFSEALDREHTSGQALRQSVETAYPRLRSGQPSRLARWVFGGPRAIRPIDAKTTEQLDALWMTMLDSCRMAEEKSQAREVLNHGRDWKEVLAEIDRAGNLRQKWPPPWANAREERETFMRKFRQANGI